MPTSILANVMAPYVAWGIGEDEEIGLAFSMLATLLAAFLERPFTRMAGFSRHALKYSLRANILSWFIGLALAYASLHADRRGSLFFAMVFLAIPFSISIEGAYMSFASRLQGFKLNWKPIVLGNVFSGFVLLGVRIVGFEWGDHLQLTGSPTIDFLRDNRILMTAIVMYLCIATFLFAMFVPTRSTKTQDHDALAVESNKRNHNSIWLSRLMADQSAIVDLSA